MSIVTTTTTKSTPRPSPADVCFDRVSLGYGGPELAVHNINLVVEPGEIVMLLGPSGCGKSTLLRAVAGLLRCAAGEVRVGRVGVAGPSAERAMMFQEDALLPWRTAQRNVELALQLRGVRRSSRRTQARDLLAEVGLTGYEDHLPRELSGGMRQRVQLARTLAMEPRVLLMDEPFGALDAQTRTSMQTLLAEVAATHGSTIVFVTHDVDEALLIGDRIVVLSKRPAQIRSLVDVPRARQQGWRFDPAFNRLRYEILAQLGQTDGLAPTDTVEVLP